MTQAIRALKASGCPYGLHQYKYEEKGGTKRAAMELGVDEHAVLKTLVMEDDTASPMVIIMHGDKEVSTKAFARHLGVKTIAPCEPKIAQKHTGYRVGGTSPFGLKKQLPVYLEESITVLPKIFINAGKRGLLAEMTAGDLVGILNPIPVHVAI